MIAGERERDQGARGGRRVVAIESRTPRGVDRGLLSAVEKWVGEVGRTVLYTGVFIQHRRRDDREGEAGASSILPGAGHDEAVIAEAPRLGKGREAGRRGYRRLGGPRAHRQDRTRARAAYLGLAI